MAKANITNSVKELEVMGLDETETLITSELLIKDTSGTTDGSKVTDNICTPLTYARGRPRKYTNAADFDRMVDSYIEYCLTRDPPEPVTIMGLVLTLGFIDRQSFYEYGKNPEFTCSVRRARSMVELGYERRLSGNSPTGAIFALKNFGWVDSLPTETTAAVEEEELTRPRLTKTEWLELHGIRVIEQEKVVK